MSPLDLIGLASRVSDGDEVDWQEAGRGSAGAEERRILGNLRVVERVARAHRGRTSGPPEALRTTHSAMGAGEGEDAAAGSAGTAAGRGAAPPDRWGSLEIRSRIGEGGFGEVFLAWDPVLRREVALKLLKPELSSRRALASRVIHEGRLLARVTHPNVVTVHGADSHDGRLGLWMELVRGRSLGDLVREQGPLGPREAALIGIEICRALAAVHRAGVVHRDVKAHNVMRQTGGRILLMDFGAGHETAGEDQGSISGTPLYMAPEIHAGGKATAQSDLYSLGVLLYHLVTGAYPVSAANLLDLKAKVLRREIRLLRDERPDLPEDFVRVVDRALAWEPRARFTTPGQLEQALAATLGGGTAAITEAAGGRGRRPSTRAIAWAAASVAVLLIGFAIVATRGRPVPGKPGDGKSEALGDRPAGSAPAGAAYTVEAALYRTDAAGRRERLESGGRLALGDQLSLEFRASRPVYLYVIDEDERGRAYALFPLPGLDLTNPLPAGRTHLLPGTLGGRGRSWIVNTSGGREHILVLASPERQVEFEAELAQLPRPEAGGLAMEIPGDVKVRLRGIGALGESEARAASPESAGRLFDLAERLAGPTENAVGAWLRRIDLDNPEP